MYLPTFWKLTMEAWRYKMYHLAGWGLPGFIFVTWLLYPSIYNWVYSDIYPPERGVRKRS
ncbi:unnamed protein product [Moneuplotes crassus]|uniref:Uncharacterized protein n=1 Tax=Euplotes crassus TaxID=5936 RepID=A0AAD1Y457_EUPCR|nr:unnamed protein product [Moneuplotes crassus]